MFIETKFNFTPGRIGKFFAEELNILVTELQNIIKLFGDPTRESSTQIVESIIGAGTISFFETSLLNNVYTLYRPALPSILQYPHVGTCGYFIPSETNKRSLPMMSYGNGVNSEMKMRGMSINTGDIIEHEVYMFIYREVKDDLGQSISFYFDVYPVSITGDVIVNNNSGTAVTTSKIIIESGNIVKLPSRPNGDIIMGTAKVYDVNYMNVHAPYDASVESGTNTLTIHSDDDLSGKYAVVSYTL